MQSILFEIKMMRDGTEKDFLEKTFYSVKKYVNAADKKSLELIISRLDGLYDGLTAQGKKIALMFAKEIMEEIAKI